VLTILPRSDRVLQDYLDPAQDWSTVTPVLLPRHHGYAPAEAESELRRAFVQAGYAPDLVERLDLEWRRSGFRAGAELASKYLPPENLANKPRYHVKVRFPRPVPGPIAVGSGRFRGFGLFARA
jgi:CRISPR-associated protein Csb2